MRHLVIIPTYNEIENIASIIRAVASLSSFDILIVDDNSPDGTAQKVRQLQESSELKSHLHLLERSGKLGLGTAYIEGFKFGLKRGYDFLYEMDADFSHDPNDLLRLKETAEQQFDVVIGSRYVKGGGLLNWPRSRIFISKGGSLYVRLLTFMPVMDPTAGFICYSSRFLQNIDLDKIGFAGYGFQIEMKYVAWKLGFKIKEIPIVFRDREKGTSKMHLGILKEAVMGVLKLRFRNIRKFYAKAS